MNRIIELSLILFVIVFTSCGHASKSEQTSIPEFEKRIIADSLTFIWANAVCDINDDGIADLLYTDNNAHGGKLAYRLGDTTNKLWEEIIIAEKAPNGMPFASGDLDVADMDADGDIDIVTFAHTGEWDNGDSASTMYWFENPDWVAHEIGMIPNFVKDISIADFNKDNKSDIAILTFHHNTLSVFQQTDSSWYKVLFYEKYNNVHEGMDIGDFNGDGWTDLVVNGIVLYNPKGDLGKGWKEESLDAKWNNQSGNWSRNATKICTCDLQNDGRMEIIIGHSERKAYPLSLYQYKENKWTESVLQDSLPACHSISAADFNLDGNMDVLAGTNRGRGKGLKFDKQEVFLFLGNTGYSEWTKIVLAEDGIYNSKIADYDGDGDMDIFRYASHDAKEVTLYENKTVK